MSFERFIQPLSAFEYILNNTLQIVVPFTSINLVADDDNEEYSVTIKVNSKILEKIKKMQYTDKSIISLNLPEFSLGVWNSDMVIGFKTLNNLSIFPDINNWIKSARNRITLLLPNSGKTHEHENDVTQDYELIIKNAKGLLDSINLIQNINNFDMLKIIMKESIKQMGSKIDRYTLIYRFAMGIYHAKSTTGDSISKLFDNPSNNYLKFISSEFYTKNQDQFKEMMDTSIQLRIATFHFIIIMALSIFIYYNISGESND